MLSEEVIHLIDLLERSGDWDEIDELIQKIQELLKV
jgi:hypothetical protein